MNQRDLVERLSALYTVHVRSQYHIQVETPNGPHNIWFSKGRMQFEPCGSAGWKYVTTAKLLHELERYDYSRSDRAAMIELSKLIEKAKDRTGIFTDAGYLDGIGKLAVVRTYESGDLDITVRIVEAESNIEAERLAVLLAMRLHPGDDPIHTDCQPVAADYTRAVWIPRKQNKKADKFGNLRNGRTRK